MKRKPVHSKLVFKKGKGVNNEKEDIWDRFIFSHSDIDVFRLFDENGYDCKNHRQ